jgi:hypothetical protein
MISTESAGTFLRRRWRQKVPDPDPYPPKSLLNIVGLWLRRKWEIMSSGKLTDGTVRPAILLTYLLESGASRLLTLVIGQ